MADKIKEMLDTIKTMTVVELNDLRKAIEEEFDVSAAAPVAVAAAPAAGGDGGDDAADSTVSVYVKSPGASKVAVIKVIRSLTGLGLKESKELAESAGAKAIKEGIEQAEADKIAKELEAAGAVVEVK